MDGTTNEEILTHRKHTIQPSFGPRAKMAIKKILSKMGLITMKIPL